MLVKPLFPYLKFTFTYNLNFINLNLSKGLKIILGMRVRHGLMAFRKVRNSECTEPIAHTSVTEPRLQFFSFL